MENQTGVLKVKNEFSKTCEICLKILDDISSSEILDRGLRDIIEILFIKSEVQISQDSFICTYCSDKLREAFDFKTMCIETEDMLVPFIDSKNGGDIDVSIVFNNFITLSSNSFQETQYCRLCRKSSGIEFMDLFTRFLENPKILRVFERHIPEMNIKGIKNPFVCHSCKNVAENFSNFLTTITELNKGISLDDHQLPTTSSFPVENNNILRQVSNSQNDLSTIKVEVDETNNEINNFLTVITNMDKERTIENSLLPTDMIYSVDEKCNQRMSIPFYKKVLLEGKWVYVKAEQEEPCTTNNNGTYKRKRIRKERKIYTCEKCNFKTKNIQSHRLLHADLEKIRNFKCSECSFVSKYLHSIKRHMKIHEKIAQNIPTHTKIHNCQYCSYTTINPKDIRPHIASCHNMEHKQIYKCSQCDYWTCKKTQFDFHFKKHQRQNQEGLKKCNLCNYWTRFNNHLKRHMAYHTSMKRDAQCSPT